jgi:DNA repair protein RadC
MVLQVADPGTDACVSVLHRAGLELREHAEEGNGTAFLLQGNTFAHKELLKRYGGRWSRAQQGWLFDSLEPIRDMASALPANGEVSARGLADAPAAFEAAAPSFAKLRKRAQNSGHRNRLRARLLEAGPQALPDYELLELLLFFSIDFKDTKPLAKELLARYGSLGGVLNAEPAQLAEFHDLHKESPEIDGYLAYRVSELYQRDREADNGALSDEGSRWRVFEQVDANRWEIVRLWRRRETGILLKVIGELLKRVLREEIRERPVIGSWTALLDYLQVALAHEPIEQFR